MWFLNHALRRPISMMVVIVALVLGAVLALISMRVDIFPDLDLPVIYVIQPYGGMDPSQMEGYLVDWYEQHFFYIDGISSVESKSIPNVALIKLSFHPGTDMAQAMSNTVGMIERSRAYMPPGTVGPFVMRFDAGSVPVGFLVLESKNRSLASLQDLAITRVRPIFSSLPGVSGAPAFGGNQRTVVITLKPEALKSFQISAKKVIDTLVEGNVIIPNGDVRINGIDRLSSINSVVTDIEALKSMPIMTVAGPTVFLGELADVKDSSDVPTGYALVNGKPTVYIPVVKLASASTLTVVKEVKDALASMRHSVPADVSVSYRFDQSPYVTNAIANVSQEGIQGAVLTSLMVLLFLKDVRSALIVMATIPSAILGAIVLLWMTGQTINIMTLGGLALAIGVLVDQATVTIENVHTHLDEGQPLATAVYEAGKETVGPNFLAMLAVLSVFVPSFFMQGITRALFIPLSLAVGFALIVSFILSATMVPIFSIWFLKHEHANPEGGRRPPRLVTKLVAPLIALWTYVRLLADRVWLRVSSLFPPNSTEQADDGKPFEKFRARYASSLESVIRRRKVVLIAYAVVSLAIVGIVYPLLRKQVFPQVQSGQFVMLVTAPSGLRFEDTTILVQKLLDIIGREAGGSNNVHYSIGYVGMQPPAYALNNMYMFTSGPNQALLTIALDDSAHIGVVDLEEKLRRAIPRDLPGTTIIFEPGDIVTKIMNLGAATPVEVAVTGLDLNADIQYAKRVQSELSTYPKFRDLGIQQSLEYPTVNVAVDREMAGQMGVTVKQIGQSLVSATSSSRWIAPNYWRDPKTGVSYQVQIEFPQWHMSSLEDVGAVPVMPDVQAAPFVRDVAKLEYGSEPGEIDHWNQQRMLTVGANVIDNDLGRAAAAIDAALDRAGKPPRGVFVKTRGQIPVMNETFGALMLGLVLAAAVILLMLTATFQSAGLAFIVICATPGILSGVVLALLLTNTSVNIESFMGGIMAVGVGVANAILLVTFASHYWTAGRDSSRSAVDAGVERLRPILMTSIAMIVGMIPMSVSPEAQSNLARAVIGGLLFSMPTVLFILPAVFSIVQEKKERKSPSIHPLDNETPGDHVTDA